MIGGDKNTVLKHEHHRHVMKIFQSTGFFYHRIFLVFLVIIRYRLLKLLEGQPIASRGFVFNGAVWGC